MLFFVFLGGAGSWVGRGASYISQIYNILILQLIYIEQIYNYII